MPNTIVLKGKGIRKERISGGAINPGHLIERTSTGTVIVHAGAGLNTQSMFAIENEVIGGEIDTAYASGDNVLYEVLPPGAEVNALLAAAATAVVAGDYLESDGDGTLRILTTDTATDDTQREACVAVALESVDNSGGGGEVRIKVEVL